MIGREVLFKLKNCLKPIISVKCLLITRIPFALYSKWSGSRIICTSIQIYCMLIAFATTYAVVVKRNLFVEKAVMLKPYFSLLLIQGIASISLSLYSEEEYIITYSKELKGIGRSIGMPMNSNVPVSYFLLWTGIIGKALGIYLRMKFDEDLEIDSFYFVYHFVTVSIYASRVTTLCIIELLDRHMWSRRRYIQEKFDGTLSDDEKMLHLDMFFNTYKKLINILKPTLKYIVFTIVLGYTFDFFNIILIMCHTIFVGELDWITRIWIIQSLLYFLALSSSSMFYQSVASEQAAIQEVFAVHLLSNSNGTVRQKLRDMLDYVKYHPIMFSVWRHFPAGLQLSAGFFNIAITYTICILQFSY